VVRGKNGSRPSYIKGRGAFYRPLRGLLTMVGYFTTRVKLHS
jgi:hypothetical protein